MRHWWGHNILSELAHPRTWTTEWNWMLSLYMIINGPRIPLKTHLGWNNKYVPVDFSQNLVGNFFSFFVPQYSDVFLFSKVRWHVVHKVLNLFYLFSAPDVINSPFWKIRWAFSWRQYGQHRLAGQNIVVLKAKLLLRSSMTFRPPSKFEPCQNIFNFFPPPPDREENLITFPSSPWFNWSAISVFSLPPIVSESKLFLFFLFPGNYVSL